MTTIPLDQFSKQMMEELLSPFGQVQLNREVLGASRYIDLWFSPQLEPRPDPSPLGLLGRLTTRPCLFAPAATCRIETFRNSPSKDERESGYLKLQSIRSDSRREAKREKRTLAEEQLPLLWILTPTTSARLLRCLEAQQMEDWPQGVYEAIEDLSTQVIAIHQLPETDETLWLRLLGKG